MTIRPPVTVMHASAIALVLLSVTTFDAPPARALADAAPDIAVVQRADFSLQAAIASGNAERTASFYAEDAVLLHVATPIVEGRARILAEWQHVFGIPGFANASRRVAAYASGNLAFTRGTYESPMLDRSGQRVRERGKWMSVWKRQRDNQWQSIVDMFNTDAPPPDQQRRVTEREDDKRCIGARVEKAAHSTLTGQTDCVRSRNTPASRVLRLLNGVSSRARWAASI